MNKEESLQAFDSLLEGRNWKARDYQRESVEKIVDWFEEGKKCVLYCAPTGSGKTIVNWSVAQSALGAYYVTGNLSLQDQIIQDRFEGVSDIRGRSNYDCNTVYGHTCDVGLCQTKKKFKCMEVCEYKTAKVAAQESKICLSNMFYFILEGGRTFGRRELLIIDEGHNLPEILVQFGSVRLSPQSVGKDLYHEIETYEDEEILRQALAIIGTDVDDMQYEEELSNEDLKAVKKLENVLRRLETCDKAGEYVVGRGRGFLTIQPLMSVGIAKRLIFDRADKVLISSATINPFLIRDELDLVGMLGRGNTMFYPVKSTFPPERRPIFLHPVCNFKYENQKDLANVIKITDEIKKIIDNHPDDKGIIFTQGYRYVEMLTDMMIQYPELDSRFVFHDKENRKEILSKWMSRFDNKVLVGIKMEEGLDLKYDMCRFAIIFKAPFMDSSRDMRVQRRLELKHWNWYMNNAQQVLMQMCGRVVRAEDDYGEVYVLDEGACRLFQRAGTPQWIREALIEEDKSGSKKVKESGV